jgi:hypothetical protein
MIRRWVALQSWVFVEEFVMMKLLFVVVVHSLDIVVLQ